VAGLVSAATRGQLPLAEPGSWPAAALQCALASAAEVWLSVRCPGLVLAMLDALAAAGGSSLDNAQLAAAVNTATSAGVSAG
jgi:hypothetical protein